MIKEMGLMIKGILGNRTFVFPMPGMDSAVMLEGGGIIGPFVLIYSTHFDLDLEQSTRSPFP